MSRYSAGKYGAGQPGRRRSLLIPDHVWLPASRIARARDASVSEVTTELLAAWVLRHADWDPGDERPAREGA